MQLSEPVTKCSKNEEVLLVLYQTSRFVYRTCAIKVQTFWEAHKKLRNLPNALYIYLVNVQTMRKIFSNFVCFSESPNFIGPIIFMIFYQSCGAEYCPITDLFMPKNSCGNLRTYFPSCFLHSDFELENFMIFIALIVLVWFGSSWVAFKTSRANISWDVQPNQEVSIKIADFAEKTVYQKSNFLDDSPKCATCKLCKLSLSLICVIYVTLVS